MHAEVSALSNASAVGPFRRRPESDWRHPRPNVAAKSTQQSIWLPRKLSSKPCVSYLNAEYSDTSATEPRIEALDLAL